MSLELKESEKKILDKITQEEEYFSKQYNLKQLYKLKAHYEALKEDVKQTAFTVAMIGIMVAAVTVVLREVLTLGNVWAAYAIATIPVIGVAFIAKSASRRTIRVIHKLETINIVIAEKEAEEKLKILPQPSDDQKVVQLPGSPSER